MASLIDASGVTVFEGTIEGVAPQTVYVQASDPGAVGAGAIWIDPTTDPVTFRIRDATDTGYTTISLDGNTIVGAADGDAAGASLQLGNAQSSDDGGFVDLDGGDGTEDGVGGATDISAGSGGGGTGGTLSLTGGDVAGGEATLAGGTGAAGEDGGDVQISGGFGDAGGDGGAFVTVQGGRANPKVRIRTGSTSGPGPLVSDGTSLTYNLAAFVANGSTVDQLRDSLISAGLMAAS